MNPNQSLDLRNIQTRLLNNFNKTESLIFPVFPLIVNFSSSELKDLMPGEVKKILKSVKICGISYENLTFSTAAEIKTPENQIFSEKIPLAVINENKKNSLSQEQEKLFYEYKQDFEILLKNFRICQIETKGFQWQIWNDIWCKLK